MGFGGGFFGSGSKEVNTSNYTSTDVDNVSVDSDGPVNLNNIGSIQLDNNSNLSFETTDFNAIAQAFALADNTLDFANANANSALELASQANAPSANYINAVGKNLTLIAGVIAVAVVLRARKK